MTSELDVTGSFFAFPLRYQRSDGKIKEASIMKPVCTMAEVADLIPDGASVLIAGFLGVGTPLRLIEALVAARRKNLTLITNDTDHPGTGIGRLIRARAVRKLYASHIGTNSETQSQMFANELEVELVPQGTLVERIRAYGFGLGGVLTKTGLGTMVADSKRVIEINGESWLLDLPLGADFALIHAKKADRIGNLIYEFTADNFNTVMAMAGRTVIVEADEIVAVGAINPNEVKTPGVIVDYILENQK